MDEVWPAPGTVLSLRYRLVTQLSSGGMSQVWRAEDELLGRPVAIKLPTSSAEVVKQAFTEARTTARLSHPYIAAVHDYGETKRPDSSLAPFVVMELLDGPSLAARLADGPLSWPEAARIGAQVAEGLAAAHARQVVHRDVKPGNVMLTPGGARILDFGISAMVGTPDDDDTGATFGTPAYVAPERLDGKPAEPATDVYGLGVVLFEMVTGDPPYPVDTWEELTAARSAGPGVLPADLPPEFRDLVERCLDESPERRPSAAEVRAGLAAFAGSAATAPPPPRGFTTGRAPAHTVSLRPPGRKPWAARAGVVAVLLAAAGVAVAIGGSPERDAAAPPPAVPSPAETTAPTATAPPTTAAPTPTAADLGAAVDRVISEVEAGQAAGRIRPDVAVDLLNLIRQLDQADPSEVAERVEQLQQKVRTRLGEDGLTAEQADVLQARLTELGRVSA
ncbi:serine/threonine-protein kinase [Actinoplanes sp. NPDC051633]|uniref:serine/threonine-protein kinase n=1 Tax=Actinoplanes sp. NPDC051633 TaxID=3155670 RepID=UPI003429EA84